MDAPDTDDTRWIRILTLNAHQGFHAARRRPVLLRIRDALRDSRADIVFLQEIGAASAAGAAAEQYEVLADGVWSQFAYGRNAVATAGHHGNALLSKYPIVSWRNVDASVGAAEPRGFLHCVISVPGDPGPLHAVCLHLALREAHRRRQVEALIELLSHDVPDGAPVIVAGDFNDWRGRAHRRLTQAAQLVDVHAAAGGRTARTFPARLPLLRLDRIYVRNLRHRPVTVPSGAWSTLSDHLPLAGELLFPLSAGAGRTGGRSPRGSAPC